MDALVSLRSSLAETWAFGFKAHTFHWNVEGPLFPQLHEFFGDIYEDADGAVDGLAEQIRALGEMAPASLSDIVAPAKIVFSPATDAPAMVAQLSDDNMLVIDALEEAQGAASAAGKDGLANYLQDRIDRHSKWGWMLKASLKRRTISALHDNPRSVR